MLIFFEIRNERILFSEFNLSQTYYVDWPGDSFHRGKCSVARPGVAGHQSAGAYQVIASNQHHTMPTPPPST